MARVHDRLRQARVTLGMSQRELSELSDTPQSQLSRIERGAIDPAFSTVVELTSAMRVSLDALVHATDVDFGESLEVQTVDLIVTMGIAPQTGRPFLISRFASPSPHSIAVGDTGSGVDRLIRLEVLRTLMGGGRVSVVDPSGQWAALTDALGGVTVGALKVSNGVSLHRVSADVQTALSTADAWRDALIDAGHQTLLVLPPLEDCHAAADLIALLASEVAPVGLSLTTASASELAGWTPVVKQCGWRWVVRQNAEEQSAVTQFLGSPHPETVVFGGGYVLAQTSGGETTLVSLDPTPAEASLID